MENKVAASALATAMASATGKSRKACEEFIREFFRLAAEVLGEGESIKLKGFGTFKVVDVESRAGVNVNTGQPQEIAPHKKVTFTPTKELSSAVNAPFEDFVSVEMEEDEDEDILYYEIEEEEISDQELQPTKEPVQSTETANNGGTPESSSEKEKKGDEDEVSTDRMVEGSNEEGEDDIFTEEAYKAPFMPPALPEYVYPEQTKSKYGIGFLTGALSMFALCAIIFMLGCFFDWWPENFGFEKSNKPETTAQIIENVAKPEEPQLVEEVEEEPVVYDTVSTTRYLTTIARDHYGNFNFWPYIYKENEAILGHPNRITPGTQVVVPPLSKYGVDPSVKEDVEKAKKEGYLIYQKYN